MIKMSCPYCEAVHNVKEIRTEEKITFKEKLVSYTAIHYECCNCHEYFETAEMMDANLLAIREAYEEQYESIKPEKIIAIREKYNASQKAFGLILGMGELTINSYEQGKSVPNSSNKLILQLADNPLIFFEMYEKNKNKIGAIQRERIESSLAYINCKRWGGLENLYTRLSESEREVLESKTYIVDGSVGQIVADMIKAEMNKSSFAIYQDAREFESGTITDNIKVLSFDGVA